MKTFLFTLAAVLVTTLCLFARGRAIHGRPSSAVATKPVLVELFTSEGCSSCPPADALLESLDAQPVPGEDLVVLSEHVDYWNHDGWKDPYSSASVSERQGAYGNRLHLKSVYTPQMIVDGEYEFVGSSSGEAQQAFTKAKTDPKVPIQIRELMMKDNVLHARVEGGQLPANARRADVILVVALNRAESQVAKGENAGRHLTHVAVVRSMTKVGTAEAGRPFSGDVTVKLDRTAEPQNIRVIAFLQESGQGPVLGATTLQLSQ